MSERLDSMNYLMMDEEDEWWKTYSSIEYTTARTGEGNWPMALAGTAQGANVMNPLNAFIFGRNNFFSICRLFRNIKVQRKR